MTAPQSPSSPKRVNHHDCRAAMDDSPTKRRRQGGDGLTTPPPSTSSAIAGPSTSSSPRRRSPRLMQRVADQTQAGPSGPFDATSTTPSGTTAPRRRPAQTQASASASQSSPIMPLRSRTAPGPRRSAGSLGLESETGCRRPTAAVAPTMRPPPAPRPSTSSGGGGPSGPPSSSPSSLFSRRPLGEMTLADADRQARAIRSRHEEVEERRDAQQADNGNTSSNDPPATPSRTPATGASRRTFSLGRRSTPRRTASSSSSAGPSVARRGPVPTPSNVSFMPSSDALNADETSFSTSSIFDESLASTTSTSAADGMPATPRDGQHLLGVAEMAAAARYHAPPSSPSGAPRTPSRRRAAAAAAGASGADQAQLESPPSDENDDSPGRERRRRREAAAAAVAAMAAEKAQREEEGGEGEGGEPVLLEKGDYREVVAGRTMRGGGGRVGMS